MPGVSELNERIAESRKRLNFLLDIHMFSEEDIKLNSTVLTWPKNIQPVFEANDDVSNQVNFIISSTFVNLLGLI